MNHTKDTKDTKETEIKETEIVILDDIQLKDVVGAKKAKKKVAK